MTPPPPDTPERDMQTPPTLAHPSRPTAEDTQHPDVPATPSEPRGYDRIVNGSGTYSQAHWRDEHLEQQERVARLRACAQYEVEGIDKQMAALEYERTAWQQQVDAHSETLRALHNASQQIERRDEEQRQRADDLETAVAVDRGALHLQGRA